MGTASVSVLSFYVLQKIFKVRLSLFAEYISDNRYKTPIAAKIPNALIDFRENLFFQPA
jgi:hypothetical protein